MKNIKQKPQEIIWAEFAKIENLTPEQVEKFQKYAEFLVEWNEKFNLTAITNLAGIVRQHFQDSIILRDFVDLSKISSIADIGAGAGFPSIPLKILFPDIKLYLIEVTQKKQKFLSFLIDRLSLQNTEIINLDWRTFLRKTDYKIDYFVTKAALHEVELIRMFQPSCAYKNAKLVYWASQDLVIYPKAEKFILQEKFYKLAKKERKLVFMGNK
ncbi:MAG: Ribosomal RNA small subunit methyltransferase G [candidate division TM6 bacterium GW2011_GWF2_28_16]|nr:MAG: Ribosomal RNA small subunit methyltransferase G [candidate division TM6 bacterium GW2011_GWF2_28_16]